ncbi:hypothetical protein D3C83_97000 [compost metagenome]
MLPWSVIATAGMPSAFARSTSSGIEIAPSRIEYCVCRCRCAKDGEVNARSAPCPEIDGTEIDGNHSHSMVAGGLLETS